MITVIKQGNAYNRRVISLEGLSTDTKPVEYFIETDSNGVEVARVYIENGSTFTEIDTGKLFMYDAENTVWYEIETSGGGGGGGTDNYDSLSNKPQINGTVLSGNKTSDNLGLQNKISATNKISSDFVDDENSANKFMSEAEKTKLNSIEAVGAIYKSTSNTNPSTIFDGTWTLVHSGYERQQIGTQVLYDEISGSGNVGKTNLIGAYGYGLIDGLFSNISVPSGCHKEYRITFQGRTNNDNRITIYLNNIATSSIGTWSSETFRMIGSSQFFKESDITLEPTMGYVSPGCNLKYQVTGVSNEWNIHNISVSGFIVTDAQIYTWRRTA